MRSKETILKDGTRVDLLTLEVLLDIRQILMRTQKAKITKKRKKVKGTQIEENREAKRATKENKIE